MHGHRKGNALVPPGNAGPGTLPSSEFDHARAKVILQESARPNAEIRAGGGRIGKRCGQATRLQGEGQAFQGVFTFRDTPHGYDIRKRAINEARERSEATEFAGHKGPHNALQLFHRSRQGQATAVSTISTR